MMDMDKFKQNSCVYYIASHGLKKITDCYNDTIKAYGATRVQWIALYYIENSDGIRQTELAEQMDSRETTIARLAGRLIKNGLVERRADDNDRRAVKLYCTEEGHAMYKRLLPVCRRLQ